MKKFLFIAIALFAFACSKEEAEPTTPQLHPVTINVADFPTTRADVYGKTTWEKGDKLWVEITLYSAEMDLEEEIPIYLYPITYNGSTWESEKPILLPTFDEIGIYVTYCPNMSMTFNYDNYLYFLQKTTNKTPYLNEFLSVCMYELYGDNQYYDINTNTLNISFDADWDNMEIGRNNRIRVNYKPNTEIKVSLESVTYAIRLEWIAPEVYGGDYENIEFNTTTDADGNAFIYALWYPGLYTDTGEPSITIKDKTGSKILKEKIYLPYEEYYQFPYEREAGGRAYVLTVPQE